MVNLILKTIEAMTALDGHLRGLPKRARSDSVYGSSDKSGPISEMIGFLAFKKLDTQHFLRAGRVST